MRRTLVKVHLWLGLGLGLFWAVAGVSGALLVFNRELDREIPALTDGPMTSLDRLIHTAERYTGRPIQRITAIGPDLRLVEARYDDSIGHDMALRLDAHSGEIIRTADRDPVSPFGGDVWRWVYMVHTSLLAGDIGRAMIGISGMSLCAMLVLGLTIAWPVRGQWRNIFAVSRWRKPRQHYYGWHKAVGLVLGVLLIFIALSGAYMSFTKPIANFLARSGYFTPIAAMAHYTELHPVNGNYSKSMVSGDQVMAITRRIFPTGTFANLETPVEHSGYYSVRLTLPEELRVWSGRAMVQVDDQDGHIIDVYDPRKASWLNKLDDSVYPLHKGEAGGPILRIIVLLCGLVLPGFLLTGLLLWLPKRR